MAVLTMKNATMRRTMRLFLTITLVGIIAISAGAGAVAAQEGRPCNLGYLELTCYDNEEPPAEQPPAEQPPAEQPPAEQPPAEQPIDESLVSLQETLEAGIFEENTANTQIAANLWERIVSEWQRGWERGMNAASGAGEGIPTNISAYYDPVTGQVVLEGVDQNGDAVDITGSDG